MHFLVTLSIIVLITHYIGAQTPCWEIPEYDISDEQHVTLQSLLYKLIDVVNGNERNQITLHDFSQRFDKKSQCLNCKVNKLKRGIPFLKEMEKNKLFIYDEKEYTNETLKYLKERQLVEQSVKEEKFDGSVLQKQIENNKSWTVIQRRQDGSVDFYKNWNEYKNGFGKQDGEFFIGLDKMHQLTNESPHELLIIFEDFDGNMKYALYENFLIGSEEEKYQLKNLGEYHGNVGDYLRPHSNMYFSTKDRDNDIAPDRSCAEWFKGAWWYYHCIKSNLNGPYRTSPYLFGEMRGNGVTWGDYYDIQYSYKFIQMMIHSKTENLTNDLIETSK